MQLEQIIAVESWTPPTRSRLSRSQDNTFEFYKWYRKYVDSMRDEVLSGQLSAQQTQESRRQIAMFIRRCHKYLVVENIGCHYVEQVQQAESYTEEHLIPQMLLIDAFIDGLLTFNQVLSMPMVKLSSESDKMVTQEGYKNNTPSWQKPFKRYLDSGVNSVFVTQHNKKIDIENFTLVEHFKMFELTNKKFYELEERMNGNV